MERQEPKNLREYSTTKTPFFEDAEKAIPPLSLNTTGFRQLIPMQDIIIWQNPNQVRHLDQENTTSQLQIREKVVKRPFEFTLEFLQDAEDANIPGAISNSLSGFHQQKFLEGLTILERLKTGTPTKQIASELAYSTQSIDWRRVKTFKIIWQNCPAEIKEKYPFEELTLHNPRINSIETRIKHSLRHGGNAVEIASELLKGTDFSQLKERFGIDAPTTSNLRRTLANWGIELPYEVVGHQLNKTLDSIKNGHIPTDIEAEEFFRNLTISTYRNHRGENGTLMPLKEPVTEAGYRYATRLAHLYLDEIKRAGIPFGQLQMQKTNGDSGRNITVNAFFRIHSGRIMNVIRANPDLNKYKIPSIKSPQTLNREKSRF